MNNKNLFIEMLGRLASGNPKFFKALQWVSIVIGGVSFLMDLWPSFSSVVPTWLQWLNTAAIKTGAITAIIMAQLPNKDPNDASK